MPRGAFPDFAAQRTLLAAVTDDDALAAYALFAIARGRVRLIHLCVDTEFRRRGLAARLIKEIRQTYPELTGIRLKCRADFDAQHLWPKLGFSAVNEVPGRGKDRKPLTVWWLSNNRPDLFNSIDEDDQALAVAIDHNIFIDLAVDRSRQGALESQALEADWLQGQIRLTRTAETLNEILRIPDATERNRQRVAAFRFAELEHSPDDFARASEALQSEIGKIPGEDLSDFNHVVHAAAGGASAFVTRDSELIARIGDAAARVLDMRVLRPSDLVVHLDELRNVERYRPAALRGTAYTVKDVGPGYEIDLSNLLDTVGGERASNYRALLRGLAGDPLTSCHQVSDPTGRVIAAWAIRADPPTDSVVVPFLRASGDRLAETIARLVVRELKTATVRRRATAILVDDAHLSGPVRSALADDGFILDGTTWRASVLDVRRASVAEALLPEGHPAQALLETMHAGGSSPHDLAALERALWPAKLLDGDLPSYVISIQPRWARELFSLQDTLWERAPLLGLSREHVYYRSPRGNPQVPARILWYASGTGRDRIGAVVACSQLVEVVTDTPERLHRRYRHLGVYRLADVQSRADKGAASALRFVDTEAFKRPVTYERLRALNAKRRMGSLQSPTMISNDLFGAVYNEGVRRNEW